MPIDEALIVFSLADAAGDVDANALAAFWHKGMANVVDFAHMKNKDIIEICKAMNARVLNQHGCWIGTLKAKWVRSLAHWAKNLRNKQLPIDDSGFDAVALDSTMISLDTDNATNETDLKKPPKLKLDDWDTWDPEFASHLKSLWGQAGAPLDYVIQDPTKTVNDFPATDEVNRLIHAVALDGPMFQQDNCWVSHELHSFIADNSAANFVREGSNNSGGMMATLHNQCNGPGEVTKRHNKAKKSLTH